MIIIEIFKDRIDGERNYLQPQDVRRTNAFIWTTCALCWTNDITTSGKITTDMQISHMD